ncbi:rhodanese-related sulfurtransferase [Hellea sp.]|nr:rhodanese-related sulfurtransferase [Hellea sp.]MDC1062547.1 rhodanese-related sulfurtransferase [Hellea sp.]
MTFTVAALYHFTSLLDYKNLKSPLSDMCELLEIKGTILLASEGINGTVAGTDFAVIQLIEYLRKDKRLKNLEYKLSKSREMPFYRMKVRLKKEIVTMGVAGVDPNRVVGTYVEPKNWNNLINDPDVILIDTRNDYEVEIGSFKGAINPDTSNFREFPAWVQDNREKLENKKIAMFCTGGIRCEKASSYMKENGFNDVYHLKGGILKYLETQPQKGSLWKGDCFVFDQRVAVKHALKESDYDQCFACRYPITIEDKNSPKYTKGISCPKCHDSLTKEKQESFAERQKQINLSKLRGETHIGQKNN